MPDFSTRPRPRSRHLEVLMVAGGACALLLAAGTALRARGQLVAARATASEARRVLAEGRDRIRVLEGRRSGSEEQKLASRVVLGAQAPPAAVAAALAQTLPADVRLERLTLGYEDELFLEMSVRARRPAAYDEFLARLAGSPHFGEVVPGAETRDDSLQATVRARFRTGSR